MVELILQPLNDDVWFEFSRWYEKRGMAPPPRPSDGIWVAARMETGQDILIGGCCLYPCDGPFVIAEYASSNPTAPKRLFHRAFTLGVLALRSYGAVRGKAVFLFPRHRGIARMLLKGGFQSSPAICMFALPGLPTGVTWEKKTAPTVGGSVGAASGNGERTATPSNVSTTSRPVKGRRR